MAPPAPTGFLKFYLWFCGFLNFWIVKLKIPTKLISSPQKKRDESAKIGDGDEEEDKGVVIRARILKAYNLPQMDGAQGCTDCYVKVKLGAKTLQTPVVPDDLNPTFKSEFAFDSRRDATGALQFELWDSDPDADDLIGKFSVSIAQIIKDKKIEKAFEVFDKTGMIPVKCDKTRKNTKLRVLLTWDTDLSGGGESEWLNGILRNGYRCFGKDVDDLVRAALTTAFSGIKLPVVSLQLESFSIGDEAPYFNELRLLPTRSDHDIQLRAHLRWVPSSDFGIKVRAQTKFGLGATAIVNQLEIDFPVWIQAHLASDLEDPLKFLQLAATAQPKIRFNLGLGAFSTSTFPGVEEAIDFALRKALGSVLVLPKKLALKKNESGWQIPLSPVEKEAKARLSIKILAAEEVEKKQMADALDPYIIVSTQGGKSLTDKKYLNDKGIQEHRTKSVYATGRNKDNCEWNEFHDVLITDEAHETVCLQLMDKGKMSDDACGKLVISVAELARAADSGAGWSEEWYPLTEAKSGRIKLALEYARFVPDEGPTKIDRAKDKKIAPAVPASPYEYGQLVLTIVNARGLPKTMLATPSPFVTSEYKGYAGVSKGRTGKIDDDINPDWHEDIIFRDRIEIDQSKQQDQTIALEIKDSDSPLGTLLGTATITLKEILAKPGDFTLVVKDSKMKQVGDKCTLTIQARFEKVQAETVAEVGSDWLNGIIRKGWRVLCNKIEDKVQGTVDEVLVGVLEGSAALNKLYKSLTLENFELGTSPPFFVDMKMFNTRSCQDIQLLTSLRLVTTSDFSILVRCKGNTGVPDFTLEISNLELYFPLWVQVRLAGGGTGLGADCFEAAAIEEPIVKIRVSTKAGLLPGGISENTINGLVKMVLSSRLVLPNRIKGCLAKDPKTGKVMAADPDPKTKEWPRFTPADCELPKHNALGCCKCDVPTEKQKRPQPPDKKGNPVPDVETTVQIHPSECTVCKPNPKQPDAPLLPHAKTISPNCLMKPGEYTVVCDAAGKPVYASIADFKTARFRLTDRERNAKGRLYIKLIEADDLHDPDAWGTVDAFVEVSILGTGQKKVSSTVNNDTAPVWSERMDFLVVDEENEVLKFEVYDRDLFKNDFLGEVEVPIKQLMGKSGWKDRWMDLQKNTGGGSLHIALRYDKLQSSDGPQPPNTFADEMAGDVTARDLEEEEEEAPYKGNLMVTVHKATNLIRMDVANPFGSGLDPFVQIDYGRQQKKTKTKDGLNPIFNETKGFNCAEEPDGNAITISVFDEEKMGDPRVMGVRRIKMEDLMEKPNKRWVEPEGFTMRDKTGKFDCKDGSGKLCKLFLTIQYLEPGQAPPADPPPMTGGAGDADVVSRDLSSAPAATPKASLFLRVIQGNNFKAMDWGGNTDGYVSITMDGKATGKDKTRAVTSLDPVWNEDFFFSPEPDSNGVLCLKVKDEDVGMNETMGQVELKLADIRAAKNIEKKAYEILNKGKPVKGKNGKIATLTLDMKWT